VGDESKDLTNTDRDNVDIAAIVKSKVRTKEKSAAEIAAATAAKEAKVKKEAAAKVAKKTKKENKSCRNNNYNITISSMTMSADQIEQYIGNIHH